MKKTYESPSVEKIAFQYRDQVVVASGTISGICSQGWTGALSNEISTCEYKTIQADSNM